MARPFIVALSLVLLVTGCAHYPENQPLAPTYLAGTGYRFENLQADVANTDSVLVCVSFSGGGTRAGAMAYGVLRKLAATRIAGGTKHLIDEVDIISATSGGSFAAAYFGAFGLQPFLTEFRERVLLRDLGTEPFWRGLLNPYNFVRLFSPWFNRSDFSAEFYADTIFGELTYTDLQRRGRPFVVLNATELAAGRRFEFTQDRFDRLGSSLADVPLARAVAASSAFPVLLTPITFRDFSAETERYVHVVDGGILDNLGVGYVLEAYRRGLICSMLAAARVETLVFVVVNARHHVVDDIGESPQPPGAGTVVSWSLGAAIERRSDDQGELLAYLCHLGAVESLSGTGPAVHLVEVDLEDIPDLARRERLLATDTTTGLPEELVNELIDVAGELLTRSPAFARVKAALR
jgi:NTE family protein